MKRFVSPLSIFILALLLTPKASLAQEVFKINIPMFELYAPARITIQFQYTQDVSIRVSTLGASLYRAMTSPTQIQFEAENYDTYRVSIRIAYSATVNQTIVIGFFEGGRAAKSFETQVNAMTVEVQLLLSVVEAPHYPTPEEISERIWERWRNELLEFEQSQSNLVTKMSDSMIVVGSLAVLGFAVAVACLLAVFRVHGRVAELEAISKRGIRS